MPQRITGGVFGAARQLVTRIPIETPVERRGRVGQYRWYVLQPSAAMQLLNVTGLQAARVGRRCPTLRFCIAGAAT